MKHIAETALNAMKSAGAQKAQCAVTQSEKTEVNIESGNLTLMRTTFENSVSLTAIANGKKGAAEQNSWSDISKCAAEAVELAKAGQPDSAYDIAAIEDGETDFQAGLEAPEEDMLPRVLELQAQIAENHPKINYTMFLSFTKTERLYANTNGVSLKTADGRYQFTLEFAAKEGEQVTSLNYLEYSFRHLPENLLDLDNLRESLSQSERELGASPVSERFTGDVIFSPDCLYSMIQEYKQCFLGDIAMIGGTSNLKDKLGEKIASEIVNLRANPLNTDLCGSFVTNDGFRANNMDIIISGVLKNFALSQYGANKSGQKRSQNIANYVEMDAGTTDLDEIISSTKKGIIIGGHISGGNPTENGDFSGVAKNSFLIEDGKITRPVQETMLSGNLLDIFKEINAVSSERINNGTYILPWVRAGNILVT